MKYILRYAAVAALILLALVMALSGCTQQDMARIYGGEMTVTLEPGEKLEMITWKDSDLWYLTRPMRPDESPEVHEFKESSSYGVWEGTVTIIEQGGEE